MLDPICKFVSTKNADDRISIINFVYEREPHFPHEHVISSTYTLALVTNGNGVLCTSGKEFPLTKGDLFFTFSAKPYIIDNTDSLQYIYISFTGLRAIALLERLKISYAFPVFSGFEFLTDLWENTLYASREENTDLFCEALLLYSLGFICSSNQEEVCEERQNGILLAKQYIDMNYTDSSLNLKSVSEKFSYHPKYFSVAFKKLVRLNFSKYLTNRRLTHAESLIQSGVTNLKDLAELCGYENPLYFSKCFKEKYGVSPKKYAEMVHSK